MSDVLDTQRGPPQLQFPLTRFIVALMSKPLAERMTSDPQKAADGYGLPIETTTFWINASRTCHEVWPMKERRR